MLLVTTEVLLVTVQATSIRASDRPSAAMVIRRSGTREAARSVITARAATLGPIALEVSRVSKDGAQAVPEIARVPAQRRVAALEVAPVHEGAAEAAAGVASVHTSRTQESSRLEIINMTSVHFYKTSLNVLRPLAVTAAALFLLWSGSAIAQQGNEKTFASPGEAVLALYNAVKSNDTQAVTAIFGSNASPILHSGDDVADKNRAVNFITKYEQMHRIVQEQDQTVTLYIGAENWPMPIPLVKNNAGAWYFDTETGKQEILYRRVGTNENDAIEILDSLVAAQRDYASTLHDGSKSTHYAAKFLSDTGKQNGLYWKTGDDDPPSPTGPLLVSAADEAYT